MAPCGALASTADDLIRWSAFVADPDPDVLSPDSLEEMCQPQVMRDVEGWTGAMGLGFFLARSEQAAPGWDTRAACPVTSPACSPTGSPAPGRSC